MKSQHDVTTFQQRVYDATRRIPRGKVTTYGALAKAIRCGSARAVGQALAGNPFAPVVPCHRVVASDLTLGGFMGKTRGPALRRKRLLLEREGVRFEGNRVSASSCMIL
jgi:methylated-DNA-[protein]-cysteine S-methyltransferase